MKLYLIEKKGVFGSGAEECGGDFFEIEIVPKNDCSAFVGDKKIMSENGILRFPKDVLKNGINRFEIDGFSCESIISQGDIITPIGFSAREIIPEILKIKEIENRISNIESKFVENTVDPFI